MPKSKCIIGFYNTTKLANNKIKKTKNFVLELSYTYIILSTLWNYSGGLTFIWLLMPKTKRGLILESNWLIW